MTTVRFIRENARWLSAGVLLTWSSSFGQTYFIALSSGHLREAFELSHASWGTIYTVGTLGSAALLVHAGRLADQFRIRTLATFVLGGFICACLAMAMVAHWALLFPIIFALRFCGQGMMSHLALTAMGRWFRAQRGRAVSVASTGFAIAEGTLPFIFVAMTASIGWRWGWVCAAAMLALFTLPLTMVLLKQERTPQSLPEGLSAPGMEDRHWTRAEAMRHWLLWALLPGVAAPSFMVTIVFFQQVDLTAEKGWNLASYVALYPIYSLVAVSSNLLAGMAIDRFGSARLLPVYLLPLCCGLIVLGLSDSFWQAPIALVLIGCSQGLSQAMIGSIWPEYYGTRFLGAIRALAVSIMVVSSAAGPGVSGLLLDLGVGISTQCLWMAHYLVAASIVFVFISRAAERLR